MKMETAYQWRKQLIWGMLMIAVGSLALLDRAGYVDFDIDLTRAWRYWPWLLVVVGLTQIIPPTTPRYFLRGMWHIFFAVWWYVSFERVWGYGFGQTWPALLVVWGLGLMLRPLLDNIFPSHKEQQP